MRHGVAIGFEEDMAAPAWPTSPSAFRKSATASWVFVDPKHPKQLITLTEDGREEDIVAGIEEALDDEAQLEAELKKLPRHAKRDSQPLAKRKGKRRPDSRPLIAASFRYNPQALMGSPNSQEIPGNVESPVTPVCYPEASLANARCRWRHSGVPGITQYAPTGTYFSIAKIEKNSTASSWVET